MDRTCKLYRTVKIVLLVTMLCALTYGYEQVHTLNAADATLEVETVDADNKIIYEREEVSKYRKNKKQYAAPRKEGYIFGGWYKEDNENEPLSKNVVSGKAYAKFVPEDVLSVLCQNSSGTGEKTEETNVRLVTSIDSGLYNKIGFDIEIYGTKTKKYNYETTKVYKSINVTSGTDSITVRAEKQFSKSSKYFATVKMIHIPNSGFNTPYLIRPYWVTLDGTKVYGIDRYARVRNGYDGSFSVPIRINAPEESVAASIINVGYDNSELEFEGYDSGSIFDEYIGRENNGEIKILSNVENMNKDVAAAGILINLNFKVKDYDVVKEKYTFKLNKIEFCNLDERRINVGNVSVKSVVK